MKEQNKNKQQDKMARRNKLNKTLSKWLYILGTLAILVCFLLVAIQSPTAMFIGTLLILLAVFVVAFYSNSQPSGAIVDRQFQDIAKDKQAQLKRMNQHNK